MFKGAIENISERTKNNLRERIGTLIRKWISLSLFKILAMFIASPFFRRAGRMWWMGNLPVK